MSDRVIVVGVRRGQSRVEVRDVLQMIGRAGRTGGSKAVADLIVESRDEDFLERLNTDDLKVLSSFDEEKVAFHVLSPICSGLVTDVNSAVAWFSRSFLSHLGGSVDFNKVFHILKDCEVVEWDGKYVTSNETGEIASAMYLNPADVIDWKSNFLRLYEHGIENEDVGIAWALGSVTNMRIQGSFGNKWQVISECKDRIPLGFDSHNGTLPTITAWWYLLGGPTIGPMKIQAGQLKESFGRILRVLNVLNFIHKWNMSDFFESLRRRISRRIPGFLVSLCGIDGMPKGLANELYNKGITDRNSLAKTGKLPSVDDEALVKFAKEHCSEFF